MKHCWHIINTVTDGLANAGFHRVFCCWCDERREVKWHKYPIPGHGHFFTATEIAEDWPSDICATREASQGGKDE